MNKFTLTFLMSLAFSTISILLSGNFNIISVIIISLILFIMALLFGLIFYYVDINKKNRPYSKCVFISWFYAAFLVVVASISYYLGFASNFN